MRITGLGSALTLATTATLGTASASTATLTVESGGTFTTGTGLTTVNATGDVNINDGGTMIVRGDLIVRGSLEIASGGTMMVEASGVLAPGASDFPADENFRRLAAPVPEPGMGALWLCGLVVIALGRARRSGAMAERHPCRLHYATSAPPSSSLANLPRHSNYSNSIHDRCGFPRQGCAVSKRPPGRPAVARANQLRKAAVADRRRVGRGGLAAQPTVNASSIETI